MNEPVILEGLDGSNPLAFFAALGVLKALEDEPFPQKSNQHRLSWVEYGRWHPVVYGASDLDAIAEAIMCEKLAWEEDPSFCLSYTKDGLSVYPDAEDAIRDLKAPPGVMKSYLNKLAQLAAQGISTPASIAAAFGSDVVVDGKGNTKPTSFHFTAGQQTFLKMAYEIWNGLGISDIIEALKGPWKRTSDLPNFTWDATSARIYALRASDPSKEKRGSTPGAEWLAFLGLSFFPVAPITNKLYTTAVRGGWKDSVFTWPIWNVPASIDCVRSLVALKEIDKLDASERRAYGICEIYRSRINRADQGGYGSFSPSQVV